MNDIRTSHRQLRVLKEAGYELTSARASSGHSITHEPIYVPTMVKCQDTSVSRACLVHGSSLAELSLIVSPTSKLGLPVRNPSINLKLK